MYSVVLGDVVLVSLRVVEGGVLDDVWGRDYGTIYVTLHYFLLWGMRRIELGKWWRWCRVLQGVQGSSWGQQRILQALQYESGTFTSSLNW